MQQHIISMYRNLILTDAGVDSTCAICVSLSHITYAQKNDFRSHTNVTADMGCNRKDTVL